MWNRFSRILLQPHASRPWRLPRARPSGSGCGFAALSFGGPAGQIAVMHRILVEEKRWVSENRFLHALNYCMLLARPGGAAARDLYRLADAPHARRHHGRRPVRRCPASSRSWRSATSMRPSATSAIVAALFFGLKAAVLAIVLEAVVRDRQARRSRTNVHDRARGGGLCRHLLLRRAVPDHRLRRRPDRLLRRPMRGYRSSRSAAGMGRHRRRAGAPPTACSASSCPSTRARPWPARCALSASGCCCGWSRLSALLWTLGAGQRLQPDRDLLLQDGDGDLRRRLCRAGLCRAAGGRALSAG